MNKHASDGAVTTTVSALSDDRLLERTKELSGVEHHLEVVVIDHLREIQKRRLYLRRGFSSLFDYAVRELGYSDAAAWRRIKAMRLCTEVDGVRECLQNGSMTLNVAAQLQHAFDRQERKRERAARSTPGGIGFRAAAQSQNGSAPPRPAERKPAAVAVLAPEARRELVEQASGKSSREVMQLLAEVVPELAPPADRVRPLGGGRWELKVVIDDECRRGLERLKGLLSHVDPHLTLGQLMARLVREGLDRHDPARPPRGRRAAPAKGAEQTSAPKTPAASARGADSAAPSAAKVSAQSAQPGGEAASPLKANRRPDRPDTSAAKPAGDATSAPKTRRLGRQAATACAKSAAAPRTETSAAKAGGLTGRPVPAAVKREVWRRDQGRCRYVDRISGRRCGSQHLLQIDHVVPFACGGAAEPNNLRLLCAAPVRPMPAARAPGEESDASASTYSAPLAAAPIETDMRTLVLCDDSAHPGALTRAGLLGLGDCGLRFDWLEDPDRWSAERMAEYPLVIFSKANNRSQTDSAPWATETEGRALADHVARGNGLLVLHSGSALYDDSPSLRRLMGGVFAGHPPQCPVTVQPQPGHPLTRGSSAFTLRDEHYRMAMNDPQVDLFLRTASEHGTQPAGWTRRHGAGRVCMLTPGHNPEVWQHPAYQCILRNCLAWCGPDARQGAAE